MFVVRKECLIENWPTKVKVPQSGGQVSYSDITLDLVVLTVTECAEVIKGHKAYLKRVIRGWTDIVDDNGTSIRYTPENLDILVENPFFVMAVIRAYARITSGVADNDDEI